MSVISYFKETVSEIKLYTDIFMRMQRVTHYLFLAFKMILVYFQHTFHVLINEAAYHTNLVLLIKDKDKEALFNVAYNLTDNISS